MAIIKAYFEKSFYLHYFSFVLSPRDFSKASLQPDNPISHQFASAVDAPRFVDVCNAFYQEVTLDVFLQQRHSHYTATLSEENNNLPLVSFLIKMEHLYSQPGATYQLYPSLTIYFSSKSAVGGEHAIGNIFGSFTPPENVTSEAALCLGFADRRALRTVCVHEFNYSFVDQVSAQVPSTTTLRFVPIQKKMAAQGYNQWKICLYEHFICAGEVLTPRLVGDPAKAQELLAGNM